MQCYGSACRCSVQRCFQGTALAHCQGEVPRPPSVTMMQGQGVTLPAKPNAQAGFNIFDRIGNLF